MPVTHAYIRLHNKGFVAMSELDHLGAVQLEIWKSYPADNPVVEQIEYCSLLGFTASKACGQLLEW